MENDEVDVRVWTDSFQSGANFDPITALWDENGNQLAQNDDNASINPETQTYYDSGFLLPTLAAGDYIFTVSAYPNFSNSLLLSDGFSLDSEQPSSVSTGAEWSVWLDGVDSAAVSPIPEPSTYALMLGGLGLVGFMAHQRKRQKIS